MNGIDSGLSIKLCDEFTINDFFRITEKYPSLNIDVKQKEFTVDGKSFVGLISLDLSKPICVKVISQDKESLNKFYDEISKWEHIGTSEQ
jgi:phosphotransferase system HPr-like phosphotransfer protein